MTRSDTSVYLDKTQSKDHTCARINSLQEKQSFGQADLSEDNRPFLPPEMIDRIIKETMRIDGSMLNAFNRVSSSFRALTEKHLPWLYFRYEVAEYLQLNEEDDINISVQAIIKVAGEGSGLVFKMKELFGKNNRWENAWLTIRHEKFGRYTVKDIFWCDGSPSQNTPPAPPQKIRVKCQHRRRQRRRC